MSRLRDLDVRRVKNLRDPSRPWCVAWRTTVMPVSAYWYFRTKPEAISAALRIAEVRA